MTAISTSILIFFIVFGGALLGMLLNRLLPQHHLADQSKDVVKLGMGLLVTMAGMVLGLQLSSAKTTYDTQSSELTLISTRIILLDHALAHFGPQADHLRNDLRGVVVRLIKETWPKEPAADGASPVSAEQFYRGLQELKPADEDQRSTKAMAVNLAYDLGQTRWLMVEQLSDTSSVSMILVAVVVGWLTVIFISFGLFAPRNGTVIITLIFSASAVSAAIFLILEMYSPYSGLISISSQPLRQALSQIGH